MDNAVALMNDPALITCSSYPWIDYNLFITRSLYIENGLYTFSETRVQLNYLQLLTNSKNRLKLRYLLLFLTILISSTFLLQLLLMIGFICKVNSYSFPVISMRNMDGKRS